ncbi:MAG: hypothetical protein IT336_11945 [Thermomicrobiales bacterium]|nr:hypothetical protein [Thermomicrobiales bacterium]
MPIPNMTEHDTDDRPVDLDQPPVGETTAAGSGEYRSPGSVKLGPLIISARFSIILIFIIVIGFNLLLFLGVILAALYRAGRL